MARSSVAESEHPTGSAFEKPVPSEFQQWPYYEVNPYQEASPQNKEQKSVFYGSKQDKIEAFT
jgi:hypothetical protein